MLAQPALPGLAPEHMVLKITRGEGGRYRLQAWSGAAAGFVTAAGFDEYDLDNLETMRDVLLAVTFVWDS